MDLVLFGRSPLISQVDVVEIASRYKTVGLNYFGQSIAVDYLFYFDLFIEGYKGNPELFIPAWFPAKHPGTRYRTKMSAEPLAYKSDTGLVLGHKYFTASLAISWAIMQGFNCIYLVGIDHLETGRSFQHFDKIDRPSILSEKAHEGFKNFVYNANKAIPIFQTNPDAKKYWDLPFKHYEEL